MGSAMPTTLMRGILAPLICLSLLSLPGCNTDTCVTCTAEVGGTISGLGPNESLTLLNNGGDALSISDDGAFTFSVSQVAGSTYDVTVRSHTPGIACAVSNGSGTIGLSNPASVAVSCAGGTETVLHSFTDSTDGANPNAGLVMDSAGNFYGTTMFGGTNGSGTVFKISPAGLETVLYSFSELNFPQAGLTIDKAGNLYGTTSGGVAGGTVLKVSPAGAATVLYSFAGGATDGAHPWAALTMDSGGNLYGTTTEGGANDAGTVFKIGVTGKESILHFFTGGATDGAVPVAGLVMNSVGDLYGTTSSGGAYDDGTVFEISATGTETVVYSFAGGATDGAYPDAALIMDSAGSLYGTTTNGGANDAGTVFKISPTGTETVLYSFAGDVTDGHTDGSRPQSLILDSAGNIYGTSASGGAYSSLGTVFMIN